MNKIQFLSFKLYILLFLKMCVKLYVKENLLHWMCVKNDKEDFKTIAIGVKMLRLERDWI